MAASALQLDVRRLCITSNLPLISPLDVFQPVTVSTAIIWIDVHPAKLNLNSETLYRASTLADERTTHKPLVALTEVSKNNITSRQKLLWSTQQPMAL